MAFRIECSAEAERDFGLIFDQHLESYIGFGERAEIAIDHAEARVLEIRATPRKGPEIGKRVEILLCYCPIALRFHISQGRSYPRLSPRSMYAWASSGSR